MSQKRILLLEQYIDSNLNSIQGIVNQTMKDEDLDLFINSIHFNKIYELVKLIEKTNIVYQTKHKILFNHIFFIFDKIEEQS